MGGAEIEGALVEVIGAVAVRATLNVEVEADVADIALIVENDEVVDDIAEELSILRILRLLGLVSGSGVGVLAGVSSNWTTFRRILGPLA
jgi:hypothetical protein